MGGLFPPYSCHGLFQYFIGFVPEKMWVFFQLWVFCSMYPFLILHYPSFQCLFLLKLRMYPFSFLAFILHAKEKQMFFQHDCRTYTCSTLGITSSFTNSGLKRYNLHFNCLAVALSTSVYTCLPLFLSDSPVPIF